MVLRHKLNNVDDIFKDITASFGELSLIIFLFEKSKNVFKENNISDILRDITASSFSDILPKI